ncbi:MAG: glycosyltransferase [Gallionellaceae bacterium]|nr:glycosyltransferase [Gallionellaceae bacterium]
MMQPHKRRLLYVVGGRRAAPRVDVAVLFGEHLARSLFDIDWVVFDPEPAPAWRREDWNGATAYWIGRPAGEGWRAAVMLKFIELAADMRTFWLAMLGDYELIQVRDKFVSALLCLVAARLRGRLFTYWLSYPFPESRVLDACEGRARIPALSWLAGKLSGWLLYKIIMPGADHIFVQSEQMRQDMAEKGIPLDKMTPVPMGVDEGLLDYPRRPVEPDTVLYLGTLARVRRLEVLLHALVQVREERPRARLIFVGEGDNPQDRAFLEAEARRLGVADAVEFAGRLPMRDALERVVRAAVCVSPFYPTFVLRSTSPTKLIEYMALGRPVVANNHPEQAEVISESKAGLCIPWEAAKFKEAITMLLLDPLGAENIGKVGPEYVRNNRTYRVISSELEKIYLQVLRLRTN